MFGRASLTHRDPTPDRSYCGIISVNCRARRRQNRASDLAESRQIRSVLLPSGHLRARSSAVRRLLATDFATELHKMERDSNPHIDGHRF
jgi:hypothetical protein